MSAPRRTRTRSIGGDIARGLRELAASSTSGSFEGYRDRPVEFFHEALGWEPWSKQREIAEAYVEADWLTVVSANGVGKSSLAAAIGIHFLLTRGPGCRVIVTGPKFRTVQEVFYREAQGHIRRALVPLGLDVAAIASTGIRDSHGRQLIGWTAEHAERFQGVRAPEMLVIVDEASGVSDPIFEAILSLLTGGGKLLLIGNGTKTRGFFYESHKSDRFVRFAISALDSPNVTGLEPRVPGLVTRKWCEDAARLWGPDSALYKIRVLGQFVEQQEGRLFTAEMLTEAGQRWETTPATGPLVIGCDPAGDGGDGDESAFACRRGSKVTWLHTRLGLSPEAHLVEILGLIGAHRGDSNEKPRVVLDRDGPVGAKVFGVLLGYLQTHQGHFHLIGIRGSENAKRRPFEIDHVRDELWFNLVDAFRDGLAIPPNAKLEGDLAAIRFDRLVNGRAKVVKKNVIRRELGRSPDCGDAVCLAAYDAPVWIAQEAPRPPSPEWEGANSNHFDAHAAMMGNYDPFNPMGGST